MDTVLNVITALGTVVATISIISAFVLYRIQKKDEYLSKVRASLQYLNNGIAELCAILNFELAYEMAYDLVYAEPSDYSMEALFGVCNNAIKDRNHQKDVVIKQIGETINIFATSFTGPLATKYGNTITEINQMSTVFYPEYKGLFRFTRSSVMLMRNIFSNYKKLLLDEEQVSTFIYDNLVDGCIEWSSIPQFKKNLLDHLISLVEYARRQRHENDIKHLVELVELVYAHHIELSAREWSSLARQTKKLALLPFGETGTITGEFREAQKCFKTLFSNEDVVKYASLTQKIEDSSSKF